MLNLKEGSNLAVLKHVSEPSNVNQAPPDGLWNFNKVSIELSFVSVSGFGRRVGVNISAGGVSWCPPCCSDGGQLCGTLCQAGRGRGTALPQGEVVHYKLVSAGLCWRAGGGQ